MVWVAADASCMTEVQECNLFDRLISRLQDKAKAGSTQLGNATQKTDADLAQLGRYLCGSPADGAPATLLAAIHAFVQAFDQSLQYIAGQAAD